MNTKSILSSGAFWVVNKKLVKHLGDINSAILLTYMIDKESYHSNRNELILKDNKSWFFAIASKISDATTLTYSQQKRCIKILKKNQFLDQELIGVPAKLYFNINHKNILKFFTTSIEESEILESNLYNASIKESSILNDTLLDSSIEESQILESNKVDDIIRIDSIRTDIQEQNNNKSDKKTLSPEGKKFLKKVGKKQYEFLMENKSNILIPFDSDEFTEAWLDWLEHRKKKRCHYTNLKSYNRQLQTLKEVGEKISIKSIQESIDANYQKLVIQKIYKDGKSKQAEKDRMVEAVAKILEQ